MAAGAVGTPQILQLSGIGPVPLLREHRIAVEHALPGVGENLQDHLEIYFQMRSKEPVTLENPIAKEFVAWRGECDATIRLPYQIISRGTPNLWNEMWVVSANVVNGKQTPEEGMAQLQKGLESWYAPQQH